jgi:phage/plasmid primase-like uncharacterized protein
VTKATAAAKAAGAKLAVPIFKDSSKGTDFNDLGTSEGLDTVKTQIKAAANPKETEAETFERLAKLSLPDYDQRPQSRSQAVGIRPETLDKEVVALRAAGTQ